ncbi:MAG: hypothetical protein C4341_04180 [Armatimonadota bacterium]
MNKGHFNERIEPMQMFRRFFQSNLGWALIAGIAVGAAGTLGFLQTRVPARAEPGDERALSAGDLEILAAFDSASAKLVEAVAPSVVYIRTQMGEGSGVVYRPDGYIITNSHVVGGSKTVDVFLADGRETKGEVIADPADPLADVAVIKVPEKNLIAARFGDSFEVKPGQLALAIGAPFGLPQSVSFGHVSANGRTAPWVIGGKAYLNMIQTDAAINPGNSGGPLLNYKGEVIGINTIINTTTGASSGVGFAIPSNTVRLVADQLIANGKVIRAYLGLTPENLKPFEVKKFGVQQGTVVRNVEEGSAAAKAGIKPGDIITEIQGRRIRGEQDLRDAMLIHKPGTSVIIKYIRSGKVQTVSVQLTGRPDLLAQTEERTAPPGFDEPAPRSDAAAPVALGVRIRDLTTEEKAQYGSGVMVTQVEPGSPAEAAGIPVGAVIQKLGDVAVTSPDQLKELISRIRRGARTTITYSVRQGGVFAKVTQTIEF